MRFIEMNNKNRLKWQRITMIILIVSTLIASFQNCAQEGFEANGPETPNSTSNSDPANSTNSMPTNNTVPTGPTAAEIDLARVNRCKNLAAAPSITINNNSAVTLSMVTGLSGNSGHQSSSTTSMAISSKGITDTDAAAADNCSYNTEITCSIQAASVDLQQAFNASGIDVSKNNLTADQKASVVASVLALSIGNMGNQSGCVFQTGFNNSYSAQISRNFNIMNRDNSNNNMPHRCVKASLKVNVTARNRVQGLANSQDDETSAPKTFDVVINEGCWDETRLNEKDSNGNTIDFNNLAGAGTSVTIDSAGAWAAVVSTRSVSATLYESGSIYIFKKNGSTWDYHSKITPPSVGAYNGTLGVAIHGSRMAIGAYKNQGHGTVSVYTLSNSVWNLSATLTPPTGFTDQTFQKFGYAIAMNSNYIAVGAPQYSGGGVSADDSAGIVYIYQNNGSTFPYLYKLDSEGIRTGFGSSIAFDANFTSERIIVGAPMIPGKEQYGNGYVKIYTLSASESGAAIKLAPEGTDVGKRYGHSVALRGTRVAVGANYQNDGDKGKTGAVYYYANYTLTSSAPAIKLGGTAEERIGSSVALSPNGLLVGGGSETIGTSVRYFAINSSTNVVDANLSYQLVSLNRVAGDYFGYAMAYGGSSLIVGSYLSDSPTRDAGAGYAFAMPSNF